MGLWQRLIAWFVPDFWRADWFEYKRAKSVGV